MQTTFQNHDGYKECLSTAIINKAFMQKEMNLEYYKRFIIHFKMA